jgi:hypothetical protein
MTNPDIVLIQSQRLTDAANGGGSMTSTIVPDNAANNLFGPISRVNRADGNVSLRKAIVKALAADTTTYLGAHAIIAQPPSNPDVTALMFSTGSWTDVRTDAVEFIESYLVQGPQTRLWPYGTQVVGQRSIIAYQPVSDALPNIGDSYCIVNNGVTPAVSQFVRIKSISNTIQSFTDSQGTYQLNIITMGITEPLTAAYPGAAAQRYSTPVPNCVMCQTNVADAASYYGVTRLAADASSGDGDATLTGIFGQLVPSSVGEAPITDASPQGAYAIVASATVPVWISINNNFGAAGSTFYVGRAIYPGSVQWRNSTITGTLIAVDDGAGNLRQSNINGTILGSVDYANGIISGYYYPYNIALGFIPAVQQTQAGYFAQQPVTQATRGYLWIQPCNPIPVPGSTVVSYRALGRWYMLQDDGSGTLVGPTGAGTGTVKFDTGIITVTLGALPDIDSNIVFSWGQAAQYDIRTGDATIQAPNVNFTLSNPCKPSSLTISWNDGSARSVTDDGSGSLTGYGTGTINYATGEISLKPTSLPAPAVGFTAAYQTNPATTTTFTPSKSGATISITIPGSPLAAKSVNISYTLLATGPYPAWIGYNGYINVQIKDDGSGNLLALHPNGWVSTGGTIDYSTGVATFNPDFANAIYTVPVYVSVPVQYYDNATSSYSVREEQMIVGYQTQTSTIVFPNGTVVSATATAASASSSSQADSFTAPPIKVDLTPATAQPIVPGGLMFTYAGDTYIDRAGVLYRSVSTTTNSGLSAGTVDYTTGIASITDWAAGGSTSISIKALLCESGVSPVGNLCARVPGQAIKPSSFYIQFNRRSDGALKSATADADGNWTTADMTGHIDYSTGFFSMQFGVLVLDSSLTSDQKAEPWYNSSNVDGTGHIWYPNEALSGTINYSCVVQTILPLSAGVLGLDPVRLPSDGRVPIISAGNTLVFREPLTFTFTGTVAAGDTTSLPRGSLESAVLYDSAGVQVDIGLYTADLSAGTLTINTGADISSYTQPFVCTHTRGEMVLCVDAEITGQISFAPSLVNSYPAATSYVSSALIGPNAGNLQASYDTKFIQTTWNYNPSTLWKDSVQGASPTANYDDINYPIQVTDQDTIKQRVALIFTSSTGGNIAFEDLGVVGTFTTSANVAPINPATGNPYFIMDHLGFGTGWAVNNAIRFNLDGAGFPVWFARSVQVGATSSLDDLFTVETRWDK